MNKESEYMEIVLVLRDFLFDYAWLFNFSNINIIKEKFTEKVNFIFNSNFWVLIFIENILFSVLHNDKY